MTPLPTNPTVAILLNPEGKVEAVATNVSQDLNITVTRDAAVFRDELAPGKTFRSDVPETGAAFTVN